MNLPENEELLEENNDLLLQIQNFRSEVDRISCSEVVYNSFRFYTNCLCHKFFLLDLQRSKFETNFKLVAVLLRVWLNDET